MTGIPSTTILRVDADRDELAHLSGVLVTGHARVTRLGWIASMGQVGAQGFAGVLTVLATPRDES